MIEYKECPVSGTVVTHSLYIYIFIAIDQTDGCISKEMTELLIINFYAEV